jgi:hypothetical protein
MVNHRDQYRICLNPCISNQNHELDVLSRILQAVVVRKQSTAYEFEYNIL